MKMFLIVYTIGCFLSLLMSIIHIIKTYREDGYFCFTLSHLALLFILTILSYLGLANGVAKFVDKYRDKIVIFEKHRKKEK